MSVKNSLIIIATLGYLIILKHDVVAQHSELAIEKSPISISLQRPNFATMINALHPGNRIGYRFHEHEPISYGNVPVSNKDGSINIERIEAMEESYKNSKNVFIYELNIEKDSLWYKQDWTYYLKPVHDGVEMLLIIDTYDEGLPEYYGVQQCFRMSGKTNSEWRKEIANTPAFSEYDLWNSQMPNSEKKSLTYVLRDNKWQALPANVKATGARTPIGAEIDDLRTNGQPMSEVGPYKAKMLNPIDNGLITRVNLSESWVCGIHWQYTSHVTDHHPADCLHSIVNIGNIPPFSKKAIRGKIYWFEGNKDSLYDHYKHDIMDSGQQ